MDKVWERIFKKVMKRLYSKAQKPNTLSPEMVTYQGDYLYKAAKNSLLKELGADIEKSNEHILEAMQRNIFVFSGFKNYQQLREASLLLLDENGKRKSFSSFFEDVKKIDNTYIYHYLKAERQHAIGSSQMAGRWINIVNEADALPYLQYKAVQDDRTRQTHQSLHNIIRPVNDSFWDSYYPPNGWNCRCDVIQLDDDAEETPKSQLPNPTVAPMFKGNVGKDGIIFPEKHPYYKVQSEALKKDITRQSLAILQLYEGKVKDRLYKSEVYKLSIDLQFKTTYKNKKGGVVKEHILVDKKSNEYKQNADIAKLLAKKGNQVSLMPIVHQDEIEARKKIFPNVIGRANPDYYINNITADLTTVSKTDWDNLDWAVKKKTKQAELVVVQFKRENNAIVFEDAASKMFGKYGALKELVLIEKNGTVHWYKNTRENQ